MADNKTVKTANGQEIDMQALILKNEKVRAVGNMNVNARGDVVNNDNKTTSSRSAQVNKNYRKQIGNVAKDTPIISSKKAALAIAEKYAKSAPAEITEVKELAGLDSKPAKAPETLAESEPLPEPKTAAPSGGLAAAIAKAREVKQEPAATPREQERGGSGVKKI